MKTRIYLVMLALGCLIVMSVYAAQKSSEEEVDSSHSPGETAIEKKISLKTELDKVSYVFGTQIAQNLKTQGIEVNIEPLMWGLKDAMEGKQLALSQDEMRQVFTSFQQRIVAKQAAIKAQQAAQNLAEEKAFLEANKAKEGVKVLPSGLQTR